ncbi:hypothetical protein ANRL1_00336 [Anaerolineae bacterium]|nr:hypothetical protein ANRL1_00336 [Anaerolineae bacterium]
MLSDPGIGRMGCGVKVNNPRRSQLDDEKEMARTKPNALSPSEPILLCHLPDQSDGFYGKVGTTPRWRDLNFQNNRMPWRCQRNNVSGLKIRSVSVQW